jgi:hypothetical protein
MKKICLITLLLWAGPVLAQEGGNFYGGLGISPRFTHEPKRTSIPESDLPIFRVVAGQPYNTQKSVLWKHIEMEVKQVLTNGLLVEELEFETEYIRTPDLGGGYHVKTRVPGKVFLLQNYPGASSVTDGKMIQARAIKTGIVQIEGRKLEVWDHGSLYVPPPATDAPIAKPAITNAPLVRALTNASAKK